MFKKNKHLFNKTTLRYAGNELNKNGIVWVRGGGGCVLDVLVNFDNFPNIISVFYS